MFTRRIMPCALLLITLTVSLMMPPESRAYGFYRHRSRARVVYVYRRPYYRRYYSPVVVVGRPHWRRRHHRVYLYGRPHYRRYRY